MNNENEIFLNEISSIQENVRMPLTASIPSFCAIKCLVSFNLDIYDREFQKFEEGKVYLVEKYKAQGVVKGKLATFFNGE